MLLSANLNFDARRSTQPGQLPSQFSASSWLENISAVMFRFLGDAHAEPIGRGRCANKGHPWTHLELLRMWHYLCRERRSPKGRKRSDDCKSVHENFVNFSLLRCVKRPLEEPHGRIQSNGTARGDQQDPEAGLVLTRSRSAQGLYQAA